MHHRLSINGRSNFKVKACSLIKNFQTDTSAVHTNVFANKIYRRDLHLIPSIDFEIGFLFKYLVACSFVVGIYTKIYVVFSIPKGI